MNEPQEDRGPLFTEICECGHRAIDHSLCFWLAGYYGGESPVGSCGKCLDCHAFKGPDGTKLKSTMDERVTPMGVSMFEIICPDCVPGTGYICEVHQQAGIENTKRLIQEMRGSLGMDLAEGEDHTEIVIHVPKGFFGSEEYQMEFLEAGLRMIAIAASDNPEGESANKYGTDYENNLFKMRRFCWCEKKDCDLCTGKESNFLFKPTELKIGWYKYIGRSMEVDYGDDDEEDITIVRMILKCLESIEKDKKKE